MHPFISALIGGALVGLAALALMGLNGRIAGVSGILDNAFTPVDGNRAWRILFIVGIHSCFTLREFSPPRTRSR